MYSRLPTGLRRVGVMVVHMGREDDVLLATAEMVDLNFFENFRSTEVTGYFLNDLDGVLNAGEHIDAGLHLAIASFSQTLSGELVEIVEGVPHHRRPLLLLLPPRLHHLHQAAGLLWRGRAGRQVVNNHLCWNITGNRHLLLDSGQSAEKL